MTKGTWKRRIQAACEEAGTYQTYYDQAIDTLASILKKRDDAEKIFKESGGEPVIMHKNNRGETNIAKNPALVVIIELNQQALAFWRDLGLTPAGLKKLNGDAVKSKGGSAGIEALLERIAQ